MKILHVYAGPYPTAQGTQVLVGQTASLLSRHGHDVHLLCYSHGVSGQAHPFAIDRIPDLPRFTSERSGLHYKKLALDLSLALKIASLNRQWKPDIIHAHHYEALLACVLADPKRNIPKAFHAHALFGPELPSYVREPWKPILGVSGRYIDRYLPRFADGVIAISTEIQRTISRNIDEKIPVALVRPPYEVPPKTSRRNHPKKSRPIRMIYTGNLDKYQGFENLLVGLEHLEPPARKTLEIFVITNSDTTAVRKKIRNQSLDLTIHFQALDSWSATYAHMLAADFMVIPRTLPNGVPIKMVNALAAGCPVLADYRLTEDLRHEDEVFKIDMKNPKKVAEGIACLSRDEHLRRRLKTGAKKAAERLHNPQNILKSIEDFYRKILARRSRPPEIN